METKNNNNSVDTLIELLSNLGGAQNKKSSSEVTLEMNRKINQKAARQKDYAARIRYEMEHNINCEVIAVPRIYFEYQPSFVVSINGCTIKVPADGKPRKIHSDYAVVLRRRMKAIDDKIAFMNSHPTGDIREIRK